MFCSGRAPTVVRTTAGPPHFSNFGWSVWFVNPRKQHQNTVNTIGAARYIIPDFAATLHKSLTDFHE